MSALRKDIAGCRQAHVKLRTAIAGLTDAQVASPSLLPDWTVGHVLTHVARNADGMSRRISAASSGEIVEQYVGGVDGRAAEIEAGAVRSSREIIADVNSTAERLDEDFATMAGEVWDAPVRTVDGDEHPVSRLPFRRWREVEIHLVDLGLGFTPADWPTGLVEAALPRLTGKLAERCDQRALMAWALGRGPAPELRSWG